MKMNKLLTTLFLALLALTPACDRPCEPAPEPVPEACDSSSTSGESTSSTDSVPGYPQTVLVDACCYCDDAGQFLGCKPWELTKQECADSGGTFFTDCPQVGEEQPFCALASC